MAAAVVKRESGRRSAGFLRSLLEALVVAAATATIGLAVNLVRPAGLPMVAAKPYLILVPCPEPGGPVHAMRAADPEVSSVRTFRVDARSVDEFELGHLPDTVNLPYDWLDPVPEHRLRELAEEIAASGAVRVVVYGDGGQPDSGEYLGREISGRGINNVFFVSGGALAVLESEDP